MSYNKDWYKEKMKDPEYRRIRNERSKKWRNENKDKQRGLQKDWETKNPYYYFLNNARARAKQFNLPYELDLAYLRTLEIPSVCPYLGIPIFKGNGQSSENSPSLDRIIPSLGYIKGNVEVISSRANRLKNDASLDELEKLVSRLRHLSCTSVQD